MGRIGKGNIGMPKSKKAVTKRTSFKVVRLVMRGNPAGAAAASSHSQEEPCLESDEESEYDEDPERPVRELVECMLSNVLSDAVKRDLWRRLTEPLSDRPARDWLEFAVVHEALAKDNPTRTYDQEKVRLEANLMWQLAMVRGQRPELPLSRLGLSGRHYLDNSRCKCGAYHGCDCEFGPAP